MSRYTSTRCDRRFFHMTVEVETKMRRRQEISLDSQKDEALDQIKAPLSLCVQELYDNKDSEPQLLPLIS